MQSRRFREPPPGFEFIKGTIGTQIRKFHVPAIAKIGPTAIPLMRFCLRSLAICWTAITYPLFKSPNLCDQKRNQFAQAPVLSGSRKR